MKIQSIQQDGQMFTVTFVPTGIGKLLGKQPKVKQYRTDWNIYTFGGGYQYYDQDGDVLDNGSWIGMAIDSFLRKQRFQK